MSHPESLPELWDDVQDGEFFRITASLFPPSFCFGADVLLASYDPDDEPVSQSATAVAPAYEPATRETRGTDMSSSPQPNNPVH